MINALGLKSYYPPAETRMRALVNVKKMVTDLELPMGCTDRFDFNFDSPDELEKFVAGQLRDGTGHWHPGFYNDEFTERVAWGWGREQVLALSLAGWPEVARKIRAAAFNLASHLIEKYEQESVEFDTTGAFVDVPRFLEGVPDCMGQFSVTEQQGLSVTIVLDAFIATGTGVERVFRRGVATCAVLLALESLGVAASVLLREVSKISQCVHRQGCCQGKLMKTGVWLHRPGRTFDLSRMIVWLGHPGWTALLMYDAEMLLTGGCSMGNAMSPDQLRKGQFVMPGFGTQTYETDDGASKLLRSIMKAVV